MVAKATSNVPQYSGTYITRNFLQHHTRSWQAHLERISTYLTPGEGVWWEKTPTGYHFFDGDDDPEQHSERPSLQYFRYTAIPEVISQHKAWEVVLQKEIELLTPRLHKYRLDGTLVPSHNSNISISLDLSLADNSQAPVPALPDVSQAPVLALPDVSQAPVPAFPDVSQAPVPALPDSQAPVPALADISQTPLPALPDNSQAPVPALPDVSQAPVPALPDDSQVPIPALPDVSQAPIPALPDISQAPVPVLPDDSQAPVPVLPDDSQAPVPVLPDDSQEPTCSYEHYLDDSQTHRPMPQQH